MTTTTKELIQAQVDIERCAVEEGKRKYRKKLREGQDTPPDWQLINRCVPLMEAALDKFLNSKSRASYMHTRPELAKSKTWNLAYLTLHVAVFSTNLMDSPLIILADEVGRKVLDDINYLKTLKDNKGYMKKLEDNIKTRHQEHRKKVLQHAQKRLGVEKEKWSRKFRIDVGLKLLYTLIESTGCFEIVSIKQPGDKHQKKYLRPHSDVVDKVQKAHEKAELMRPDMLPMVVIPKVWDQDQSGGYYTRTMSVIMGSDKFDRNQTQQSTPSEQMFDALNQLQETAWKVNPQVLEVALALDERDHKLGALDSPADVYMPDFPAPKEEMDKWKEENPEAHKAWRRQRTQAFNEQHSKGSKQMGQHAAITIADQFSQYERIYFPWRLDFRGRAYPVTHYLNPQASDLSKGLLQFADGVELGTSGAYWLALQGANTYGFDKAKLDERVQWVHDHQAMILDSARDPLGGEKFWTEADKPWEFLAFCFEWAGYVKHGPSFKSHLKVAVDGSCNGLQHLSAMLKDEVGGASVNLRNLEHRRDVYAIVAEEVARKVREDALAGDEYGKLWDGLVDRKVVKRNVMTKPYGVTKRGMADQIAEEVKDYKDESFAPVQADLFKGAFYLAQKVEEATKATVAAAVEVMDWFKACVKVFNEADQGVAWTTPADMLVVQHRVAVTSKRIDTYMGNKRIQLKFGEATNKLNKEGQSSGIAPNIVHSFDAAHQALTILRCVNDHGMKDFGMVHDSFGCHAGHMENLFHILRDEFVKMYSYDVLADLRDQFQAQLPEDYKEELPEPPVMRNLNIEEVRQSSFFFA